MHRDSQSRKWQITINNPQQKGYVREVIKQKLLEFKSLIYYCISDEIGENGTYHTHIYFACSSAVRFSTVKNKFEGAHFEMARGTSQENRDYIFKEGKWQDDKKNETNLKETHEEHGDLPVERQGRRNDLEDLYDMIKAGYSNFEIIEIEPRYILQLEKLDKVRQTIKEEKYKNEWRKLQVTYIYGKTGTGKTRHVMEKYGYENVYRVTDYLHPFDNYQGQDVVVFEEFRSSFRVSEMLNFLDGYPLQLPARYNNKVACYTKVYIITNLSLNQQYEEIQKEYIDTWNALLRRIHNVKIYDNDCITEYKIEDYLNSIEYKTIEIRSIDNPFIKKNDYTNDVQSKMSI